MSDTLLAELALSAGLSIDWTDAHGRPQSVSPEAQRSLLEAFGYPAQSPEQIRASLGALEQQRHAHPAEALLFQEHGRPLRLDDHAAGTPYRLIDELGHSLDGRLDHDGCLPAIERPGYYRLEIDDNQQRLAVPPAACLSVEQLCGKRHIWGLTAQLYSLRRPGDPVSLGRGPT